MNGEWRRINKSRNIVANVGSFEGQHFQNEDVSLIREGHGNNKLEAMDHYAAKLSNICGCQRTLWGNLWGKAGETSTATWR